MLLQHGIVLLFLFLSLNYDVQKINQKNTWELGLIDHLYEIIKVEEESDAETNFQKVSSDSICIVQVQL